MLRTHGPSACGFAIRVNKLAEWVRVQALKNGAKSIDNKETSKAVAAPVIEGIGGCMLYIVDRYDDKGTIHDPDWEWLPGAQMMPKGFGLTFIDHLTHNLYFGNMAKWSDYYERLFQFREIRYFDIKGAKTGLLSKAMTAPDGMVRIPAERIVGSEESDRRISRQYKGEGIQHLACSTDDIYATVEAMRARGVEILDARCVLRHDRSAHRQSRPKTSRGCTRTLGMTRTRNQGGVAAADFHPGRHRADLLRDHPAQGRPGLRRRQFPGAVRIDRTRTNGAWRAVIFSFSHREKVARSAG